MTVTHQSAAAIGGLLESLRQTAPDAEVIVVDNASTDSTVASAIAHAPDAHILALSENIGFGRASNRGAAIATGHWLLFVNPDVRLEAIALPSSSVSAGLAAGALSSVGLDEHSPTNAETTYFEDWVTNVLSRFFPPAIARFAPPHRSWPPGWVSGAMFLTSKRDFEAIGGFDPRFFMYFEDRDLGRRYRRAGLPVTFASGIVGRHLGGSSSEGVAAAKRAAWALLAWFEYVGIWRGQPHANRCAVSALGALRAGRSAVACAPGVRRMDRKAAEIDGIVTHLKGILDDGTVRAAGFYPHGLAAAEAAAARGSLRQ